jgi:Ca2+/H+ antiporter
MNTTSVGITKDASAVLDAVAKQTGMSKLFLTSTVIKLFFDPQINPNLTEALSGFEADRKNAEQVFVDRIAATMRSEKTYG